MPKYVNALPPQSYNRSTIVTSNGALLFSASHLRVSLALSLGRVSTTEVGRGGTRGRNIRNYPCYSGGMRGPKPWIEKDTLGLI